eukprot:c6393_g1_i1.p1 GENE.c6393_g1_i1~~c6393_g1_i1.p1  ORF type:complete len:127 (+),score=18.90 c6393_g1_i1:35-415(+)
MAQHKQITRDEVAKHNDEKDCWIIIHDKVYDVSKFLDNHPGGPDIILESAGKDSTEGFEDVGHTEHARKLLNDHFIGDLVLSEGEKVNRAQKKERTAGGSGTAISPVIILAILLVVAAVVYQTFLQ